MPIYVTCPSCSTRLSITEKAIGRRLRCPRCNFLVTVQPEEPLEVDEPESDVDERPVNRARRRPAAEEEPKRPSPGAPRRRRDVEDEETVPAPRRMAREKEPEATEEVTQDPGPAAPAGPKKKKRRKRRKPALDDNEPLIWPWWVFGGGGVFAVMCVVFYIAVFGAYENPHRGNAMYLLIAMPISTLIFFIAMYLGSVLLGAVEMGDLRISIIKAFILLLLVNLANLVPNIGMFLTAPVWLIGLIVVFGLDMWEASMLFFINWVLNYLLKYLLLAVVLHAVMHGGGRHDGPVRLPSQESQPDQPEMRDFEENE